MPAIKQFLLVYDTRRRRLRQWEEFDSGDEAAAAHSELEAEYRDRLDDFEIVLVSADSFEAIKLTHLHFFSAAHSDSLADVLRPSGIR
jgi:hypothetical protein